MAESPPVSPASTFIVRFWREWSVAGSCWRGRIEHVQSGQGAAFLDFYEMLDFIRGFGAMANDKAQPTRKETGRQDEGATR